MVVAEGSVQLYMVMPNSLTWFSLLYLATSYLFF